MTEHRIVLEVGLAADTAYSEGSERLVRDVLRAGREDVEKRLEPFVQAWAREANVRVVTSIRVEER